MEYNNNNQGFPNASSFSSTLPEQAIPTSKKTDAWIRKCADALENIGLVQVRENYRFKDFYRMASGKMSYMELSSAIPTLRSIEELRDQIGITSFLRHYDLIGVIVNVLKGWLSDMSDQYIVSSSDEYEINEYLDTKTDMLVQYISTALDMRIRMKMLKAGIDPDYNDFSSDEERQQYINMVNSFEEQNTPAEIERYMSTSFKTAACIWGNSTLTRDRFRFFMDEMDSGNFEDKLITGRCFRHFHVGFDNYYPERWSPIEVFYSKTLDSKFAQYGDYLGRVRFMTGSKVIGRYGDYMTSKQKKMVLGMGKDESGVSGDSGGSSNPLLWNKKEIIPFKGYYDYQAIVAAEDFTGSPMGVMTTYDKNGNEIQTPRFLSRAGGGGYSGLGNSYMLAGEDVRPDLLRVLEAYWVSYKQVYYITYVSETGLITQDFVTDEILQDFLRENGISRITCAPRDGINKPEVNTYFVDYIPEVRRVIKISGGCLGQEALYIDGEPITHQIKGGSNLYDFVIPVSSYVGESIVAKIEPYQVMYNFSCNQIYNLLEKEIGVFMLTDVGFLMKEYKDLGISEDTFGYMMDVAKSTGLLALDTSRQNTGTGVPFNQFAVYDMTLNKQIESRIATANLAMSKAFEMLGLTPQALGSQSQYETAEGIRQGVSSSHTQTQYIFDEFEVFKRKSLDMHLAVAQQCQKTGRDEGFLISGDDLSKAYIQVSDDNISLRNLNVFALSNSSKRKRLEEMRRYLLSMNIPGMDLLAAADVFNSDSSIELRNVAKQVLRRAREEQERASNMQLQAISQEKKEERDILELKHQHKMEEIRATGEMGVRKESVRASGIAADGNADQLSLQFVEDMTEKNLREVRDKRQDELANRSLDLKESISNENLRIKQENLDLKKQSLEQRRREDRTNRFTSIINKN